MALMELQSSRVKWDRGTSVVMGTTATVDKLEAMCFFTSTELMEPEGRGGGEGEGMGEGGVGGGWVSVTNRLHKGPNLLCKLVDEMLDMRL